MALLRAVTKYGEVRGHYAWDQSISVFKGIPYAAPPVGELRWKAPQPPAPWEGVLDAEEFSDIPMQARQVPGGFFEKESYPVKLPRSEDCLYVNVWTPAETADEKLPVNVWIYGGGFQAGYANKLETDGEAFAKRGIVFVSFNYRVAAFGYLAHPELSAEDHHGVSGNYGLQDQMAALRWVRENIAAFGGDPDCVTIMGQSGGAVSVEFLALSDQMEGLFRRAIMESGGGCGGVIMQEGRTLAEAEEIGEELLAHVGVKTIEEARKMSAEEFLTKAQTFQAKGRLLTYMPVTDGFFIKDSVLNLLRAGRIKDLDFLLGTVSNEASSYDPPVSYPDEKAFDTMAEKRYGISGEDLISAMNCGSREEAIRVFMNNQFTYEMEAAIAGWKTLRTEQNKNAGYIYRMTRDVPGHEPGGTFHSGEHMYIFRTLNRSWRPFNGNDYDLSRKMCDYWCNFVKTGNPNGEGLPEWGRYTEDSKNVMKLDVKCACVPYEDCEIVKLISRCELGR